MLPNTQTLPDSGTGQAGGDPAGCPVWCAGKWWWVLSALRYMRWTTTYGGPPATAPGPLPLPMATWPNRQTQPWPNPNRHNSKNPLLVYTPPVCTPQRRLEVAPTVPSPLSRSSSQMESYNYSPSDIVMDQTSLPMINAPILRRQIAFEQDSEMSPPPEREC